MDFGFGIAAQKKVAELSHHQRWDELSRVLSTIVCFYAVMGLVLLLGVLLGSHRLISLFEIREAANIEPFRQVLVMFIGFIALSLPLGIAIEILYGQQRIALANNLGVAANLVNFGLIAYGLHHGWGLKGIMICALLCALVPTLIGGWLGLRSLPGVRIHPRLFSWNTVRETLRFSIFAYIGLVTTILIAQTQRLVLGVFMTVAAVTLYQAGAKVAEIFTSFTSQLPETISPAAAHLSARGDGGALQRLLADGTRFNVMLGTPLFLLCAFFMEGLLHLLTKGQAISGPTFWTGQTLLLWSYSMLITHGISKKVFMMTGHERRLTVYSVAEAALCLALSITLVLHFQNVVAVAVGALLPSLVIGWGYLWPWAAREAGVKGWQLAAHVLFRNWWACAPLLLFGLFCRALPVLALWLFPGLDRATLHWLDFRDNNVLFVLEGALASLLAAAGLWRWALTDAEREKLLGKFSQLTARFARPKLA
jgi:O-antigen/teichoic acid export membrane protein